MTKQIIIIVGTQGHGFVASFDSWVHVTGETPEQALTFLRDMMADTLKSLQNEKRPLGPVPKRTLKALQEHYGLEVGKK